MRTSIELVAVIGEKSMSPTLGKTQMRSVSVIDLPTSEDITPRPDLDLGLGLEAKGLVLKRRDENVAANGEVVGPGLLHLLGAAFRRSVGRKEISKPALDLGMGDNLPALIVG